MEFNPQDVYDLFVHRTDVYAEQQPNGMYLPVRQPLTVDEVAEHLAGFATYGTYTTDPADNTVSYVCWDLDVHDEEAWDTLRSHIVKFVLSTGTTSCECLLAEFSGNKGKHAWLFLDTPTDARKVRRWIQRDFLPGWQAVARERGWPVELEIFPKQDHVPEGQFGNLVKLPFGTHQVSGKKSELIVSQGWAEQVSTVVRFPANLIPNVSDEEVGQRTASLLQRSTVAGDGPTSPFPCVDQILYHGAGKGVRDNAMFHLALYLYGHAVPADLAVEICSRANEQFDPPLTVREVSTKVATAYSGRYTSARCGTDWLGEICPGPCRAGWAVSKTEENALKRAIAGSAVEVEVTRVVRDEGVTRLTVRHPDADNTPTFRVSE